MGKRMIKLRKLPFSACREPREASIIDFRGFSGARAWTGKRLFPRWPAGSNKIDGGG
jgi:hypothetical protein